jgi:hypothetical protein
MGLGELIPDYAATKEIQLQAEAQPEARTPIRAPRHHRYRPRRGYDEAAQKATQDDALTQTNVHRCARSWE